MDTNTLHSTVQWPAASYYDEGGTVFDTDYRDSGEGGLMVYAVWGYYGQEAPSFLSEVSLDMGEVLVSVLGPEAERINRNEIENRRARHRGQEEPFPELYSAVVLLGSTEASLYSERRGSYFQVTRDELTEKGLAILEGLEALYGREANLVTFLDT